MKIAELSRRTGAPVATLKYYLREGLLTPGVATAVNQANYEEAHVHRVKLVRALVELGRLSIADARRVLEAVDDDSLPMHEAFGAAHDAAVRGLLADALVYLTEFGWGPPGGVADSAMFDALMPRILADAAAEVAFVPGDLDRSAQVEFSVVGTVAFEVAGDALRRMALEHASKARFGRARPKR